MADIHIQTELGEQLSFPEELIVDLLKSGRLSPGAYYWREGMADWQPLATYPLPVRASARKTEPIPLAALPPVTRTPSARVAAPASVPPKREPFAEPVRFGNEEPSAGTDRAMPPFVPSPRSSGGRRFHFRRNPYPLTVTLGLILLAALAIAALSFMNGLDEYQTLAAGPPDVGASDVISAAYHHGHLPEGDTPLSEDARKHLPGAKNGRHLESAGWAADLLLIPVYFFWLYRTSINCRNFSSVFRLTPPWVVGYYFIPFVNLFRPCQAMQDIWRVSRNPRSWMKDGRSFLVDAWWGLGLVTIALTLENHALFAGVTKRSDELLALLVLLVRKGIEITFFLSFLIMVTIIIGGQARAVARSRSSRGQTAAPRERENGAGVSARGHRS